MENSVNKMEKLIEAKNKEIDELKKKSETKQKMIRALSRQISDLWEEDTKISRAILRVSVKTNQVMTRISEKMEIIKNMKQKQKDSMTESSDSESEEQQEEESLSSSSSTDSSDEENTQPQTDAAMMAPPNFYEQTDQCETVNNCKRVANDPIDYINKRGKFMAVMAPEGHQGIEIESYARSSEVGVRSTDGSGAHLSV